MVGDMPQSTSQFFTVSGFSSPGEEGALSTIAEAADDPIRAMKSLLTPNCQERP
jgi:hypothetical protein